MIIYNEKEYHNFLNDIHKNDIILLVVNSNDEHSAKTDVACVFIYNLASELSYLIPISHYDGNLNVNIVDIINNHTGRIYTDNKKRILYISEAANIYDVRLCDYIYHNTVCKEPIQTPAHNFYNRTFPEIQHINNIIPLVKHHEMCEIIVAELLQIIKKNIDLFDDNTYKIYNEIIIRNFYLLEKNGIIINRELFVTHFNKEIIGQKLYSDYNLYTRTGRPSNSFRGVNLAALNKEDGTREMIISRHDDGILIEFDFVAYHIALIAELIGFEFPPGVSPHQYLGEFYHNKKELTQEEYSISKSISFQLLYGGISAEFEVIPFFKKLKDYIFNMGELFDKNKFIESPISKKRITKKHFNDNNVYRLFNYLIQLHETEKNAVILYKIFNSIDKFKSKLILYTYDSLLFDMSLSDGRIFIDEMQDIITDNGKYLVKIKYGENYNTMRSI